MTNHTEARNAVGRALTKPTCPHCGSVLNPHQAISPGHCGAPACVSRHLTQVADAREQARAAETAERRATARDLAQTELADAARTLHVSPDALLVGVVPHQDDPLTPLPPERRAAFESHLDETLERAFAAPADMDMTLPPTNPAPQHSIISAACSACQGLCCRKGGGATHAFLTPQTFVHMIRAEPDLTKEDLRQTYLDALPDLSVDGSCVFHSVAGCTLPRHRRASLCNSFLCHDVVALHELTDGRGDRPVALVGMDQDRPRKVVTYDARLGGAVTSKTISR